MSAHICTHMGSVNISLKKEAYEFLKLLKSDDKSFSDVILEFRERKGNKEKIMELFGGLRDLDIDWKEKERRMKRFRESFNKRMKETRKKMEKARYDRIG